MGLGRYLACILVPPLAVAERGCALTLAVTLLTFLGWFPGVVAAFLINLFVPPRRRYVRVPSPYEDAVEADYPELPEREFMRLADGELAEIIDPSDEPPQKIKRKRTG